MQMCKINTNVYCAKNNSAINCQQALYNTGALRNVMNKCLYVSHYLEKGILKMFQVIRTN